MILQGPSIPNLIIEEAGILICIFALIMTWFGSSSYASMRRYMTLAFSSMLLYNLCLLLLEFSQANREQRWRPGVIMVGFGTYLFPLITVFVISQYVLRVTFNKDSRGLSLRLALNILMIIEMLALLAAQFTGNLLQVDAAGKFFYGPASSMGYVEVTTFMVIDMIILIRYGQNITPRQRFAFIVYLALPVISMLLRRFWPGIYIVALASCISMMIMLIVIVDEQSRSMQQRERDNEQLKVDLMLSQIQPHFLFNVLYVIQEICLVDAETASRAIADFSRYLRHNMDSISINSPIPFKEELEHVKHYVSLQHV